MTALLKRSDELDKSKLGLAHRDLDFANSTTCLRAGLYDPQLGVLKCRIINEMEPKKVVACKMSKTTKNL